MKNIIKEYWDVLLFFVLMGIVFGLSFTNLVAPIYVLYIYISFFIISFIVFMVKRFVLK